MDDPADEDWMTDALCRSDPELWFSDRDSLDVMVACAICSECPVQQECREYVARLRKSLLQGVWAGNIY